MLYCNKCQLTFEKGAFCSECGSRLQELQEKTILFCNRCQREFESGKFCAECGSPLQEQKMNSVKMQGTVTWFNQQKGYGVIKAEHGEEISVHRSVIMGSKFVKLKENDVVIFDVITGEQGLIAQNVIKIGQGIVKWYNDMKGYGFIESEDGEDVFMHESQIIGLKDSSLAEGDRVIFAFGAGEKGITALNVNRL